MGHNHHHHTPKSTQKLKVAFFLNLGFTIVEFIGGIYVNSIAIISDAVHDLGDSLSIGTSWFLEHKSNKGADHNYSFGYSRFSLLGALINSVVLILGSTYVVYEAVQRLFAPEPSNAAGMIIFAVAGIAVNGYAAWKLHGDDASMNQKVISWHLIEDVLGWAAVLVVSVVLLFTDNYYLDPILSLLITGYILWNVFKRLKETLFIFLQGVPPEIDVDEIKNKLISLPKVDSLHHTHVWSMEGAQHIFTTHMKLRDINSFDDLLRTKSAAKEILQEYKFVHYTIETELDQETCALIHH